MWVEIFLLCCICNIKTGHPPCEDVSWNTSLQSFAPVDLVILLVRMWVEILTFLTGSVRFSSSSLWGCELKYYKNIGRGKWKTSSSLWGCELKYFFYFPFNIKTSHPPCEDVSWNNSFNSELIPWFVILLVRMWVEIMKMGTEAQKLQVILLVRMWVEIFLLAHLCFLCMSSSLWGCELKCANYNTALVGCEGHPPCEDVSWNYFVWNPNCIQISHPPCEDVSWNIFDMCHIVYTVVILLVRMWVEIPAIVALDILSLSSSLWGCELK